MTTSPCREEKKEDQHWVGMKGEIIDKFHWGLDAEKLPVRLWA